MKVIDEELLEKSVGNSKIKELVDDVKDLEEFKNKMLSIGLEVKDSDLDIIGKVLKSSNTNEMKSEFKKLGLDLSEEGASKIYSGINSEEEIELSEDMLENVSGGLAPPVSIHASITGSKVLDSVAALVIICMTVKAVKKVKNKIKDSKDK